MMARKWFATSVADVSSKYMRGICATNHGTISSAERWKLLPRSLASTVGSGTMFTGWVLARAVAVGCAEAISWFIPRGDAGIGPGSFE